MKKRFSLGLILLILLVIGVRAALPYAIQRYVNRTLDRIPDYAGRIGDVDLALIRGAYEVEDVKLVKTKGKVPVPLFAAELVDFSVEWKALLHGKVVGEIDVDRGELNFVHAESADNSQLKVDAVWLDAVKKLFPFDINRFAIRNSQVHFRNFQSNPPVDLKLKDVDVRGENLSNVKQKQGKELPAHIEGRGTIEGGARVRTDVSLDPTQDLPTFDADFELKDLPLAQVNDFLKAYGKFDAEGGVVSVFSELAAKQKKLDGYVKVLAHDIDVVELEKEQEGLLNVIWEGIVEGLLTIFRNQPRRQFATTVPISGSFDKPEAGILSTIGNVFKNAFISALKPGLEDTVGLKKEEGGEVKEQGEKEGE